MTHSPVYLFIRLGIGVQELILYKKLSDCPGLLVKALLLSPVSAPMVRKSLELTPSAACLQGLITSLEGLLGSAAALLSPPALGPPDAKGNLQQSCPLLLLLDYCLADLPWESLPQLQQGTAVARDFSLHLQYIRTSAAASSQVV